jgi:(p)ppGpp synthase/HD superfamily hydrolase
MGKRNDEFMTYTEKIRRAVKFSIKTHEVYQKQKRKGKDVAYVTHPLTVGLILARADADEDVVVAGILHDTIEDSVEEKKVTKEMLTERFGERVAGLVSDVTEHDRALPWEERKREALSHIAHFSHDALLLKSADILSNGTELVDDHARYGDAVFAHFHAPKDKMLGHQIEAIGVIIESWPESPLVSDLRDLADRLRVMSSFS